MGLTGAAGTLCMRPGKIKSNGEIDLDALMPLQPLPARRMSASEAVRCHGVMVFMKSEVQLQSGLENVQVARMWAVLHVGPTIVGLQANVLAPIPVNPWHQYEHASPVNRAVSPNQANS